MASGVTVILDPGAKSAHAALQRWEPQMIEMTLPTMTCGHCVRTVTEAVQRVDGLATVQTDLPSHRLQIESTQPAQLFAEALTEAGYAPA